VQLNIAIVQLLYYLSAVIYSLTMAKRFRLKPGAQLLLFLICFTLGVWILRGMTLLSFLPGIVIYLLVLACLGVFVFNSVQSMR